MSARALRHSGRSCMRQVLPLHHPRKADFAVARISTNRPSNIDAVIWCRFGQHGARQREPATRQLFFIGNAQSPLLD
jgi:hypothetical protein